MRFLIRSTRDTIMAIAITAGFLCAVPGSSQAVTIDFTLTASEGTLMGSFSGDDDNSDSVIEFSELDMIDVTWTPNGSPPPMFSFGTPDIDPSGLFAYDGTTITMLNLSDITQRLTVGCLDPSNTALASCSTGNHLAVIDMETSGGIYTITGVTVTPQPTTAVPEPSAWLLLSTGLIGVLWYGYARRPRPATSRHSVDA